MNCNILRQNLIGNARSLPRSLHPIGRLAAIERKLIACGKPQQSLPSSSLETELYCSTQGIRKRVQIKSKECYVGLCID
jgi:hypothetical protein